MKERKVGEGEKKWSKEGDFIIIFNENVLISFH